LHEEAGLTESGIKAFEDMGTRSEYNNQTRNYEKKTISRHTSWLDLFKSS
jgi:hypothetical protein